MTLDPEKEWLPSDLEKIRLEFAFAIDVDQVEMKEDETKNTQTIWIWSESNSIITQQVEKTKNILDKTDRSRQNCRW